MFPDFFASFFSSYILLSITVLIVLLGAIYLYINTRMAEQDHKMSSMVNVIKEIMGDTQIIKSQLMHYASGGASSSASEIPPETKLSSEFNKITVSENGDNSESEYETDSNSDSDSDSDSHSNVSIDKNVQYLQGDVVELDVEEPVVVELIDIVDESTVVDEPNIVEITVDANEDDLMLETKAFSEIKKMTVVALRAMVIEKGVCDDPSKLKKNELLNLLA